MCATQDLELTKKTLDFIDEKARDQDVMYFFAGLGSNYKMRRLMTQHFQENYDAVCFSMVACISLFTDWGRSTNVSRETFRSAI